jgi:hypothetical protein
LLAKAFDDQIPARGAQARQHRVAHQHDIERRQCRPVGRCDSPLIPLCGERAASPLPGKACDAIAPDAIMRASDAASGLGRHLGSKALTVWIADGANFT